MKYYITLLFLISGGLAAVEIGPLPVVKVADGDVIVVQLNGKEERVRLLYINTAKMSEADPASPMPERRRAREMLQSCFAVRSDAWLWSPNETIERDKDQTLLAVVKYEAPLATGPVLKYVQSEMVHNGHSVYWRGMGDAPEPLHGELIKEQEHAQKNKMQAWSTAPDWMSKKVMERPAPSAVKGPADEDLLLEMRKVQAEMGGLLIKSEKQDHIEDKTAIHERLASVRNRMVEAGIVDHHRRLAPGLTLLNQNAQNFQVICNACIGNYQMAMTPVTNPKEPGVFIDTWMIPEEEDNFEELLKSLSITATMTEIQK